MGRFILVTVFGLAFCWGVYHFWPGAAGTAQVQGHAIPLMLVVGLCGLGLGYKLSGK